MTKKITASTTIIYESPACNIVDIQAEGMLCASLQQLGLYEEDYEW